jgi:hypothetical protein
LGIFRLRLLAVVISVLGREPLRWLERPTERSGGDGSDKRGSLRFDELLVVRFGSGAESVGDIGEVEFYKEFVKSR